VLLSVQKSEIIAMVRRAYKHLLGVKLPVNIQATIGYQLLGEAPNSRTIAFQRNPSANDAALYVGTPTQLVVHAPAGIDQGRIAAISAEREARDKRSQERLRREREEEKVKEAQKDKEREEAHRRMVEQRKLDKASAAEREDREREEKLQKAAADRARAQASVAARATR
jgi:myosin-1